MLGLEEAHLITVRGCPVTLPFGGMNAMSGAIEAIHDYWFGELDEAGLLALCESSSMS